LRRHVRLQTLKRNTSGTYVTLNARFGTMPLTQKTPSPREEGEGASVLLGRDRGTMYQAKGTLDYAIRGSELHSGIHAEGPWHVKVAIVSKDATIVADQQHVGDPARSGARLHRRQAV
jgi:hypothetical protein